MRKALFPFRHKVRQRSHVMSYTEDENGYATLCIGGQTYKTQRPVDKIRYRKYLDPSGPGWAFYVYDASGVRWLYRVDTEEEIKGLVNEFLKYRNRRT